MVWQLNAFFFIRLGFFWYEKTHKSNQNLPKVFPVFWIILEKKFKQYRWAHCTEITLPFFVENCVQCALIHSPRPGHIDTQGISFVCFFLSLFVCLLTWQLSFLLSFYFNRFYIFEMILTYFNGNNLVHMCCNIIAIVSIISTSIIVCNFS